METVPVEGERTTRETKEKAIYSILDRRYVIIGANVGSHIESPTIEVHAKAVVEKCEGLPLAIVIVSTGAALSIREMTEEWQDAKRELEQSAPHHATWKIEVQL
ncbi:hypothetical protein AMTR_s00019p00088510 [Amborella trichopoda]|uniref:Uncharacterized protein n=1 Tax=Amborella trichopoda TaxID=13333 RepID=W1PB09_AMBTC|nr:hypothetical protein AMTR_s00019p00088510 [Amborella trichopoda]